MCIGLVWAYWRETGRMERGRRGTSLVSGVRNFQIFHVLQRSALFGESNRSPSNSGLYRSGACSECLYGRKMDKIRPISAPGRGAVGSALAFARGASSNLAVPTMVNHYLWCNCWGGSRRYIRGVLSSCSPPAVSYWNVEVIRGYCPV